MGGGCMSSRKILWSLLIVTTLLSMVIMGCSSKKFTNTSTTISDTAHPTTYIPLDQGWRVSYTLLEPETEHFYVEVSDPVVVYGNPGFTIRRTNTTTLEQSVSFMYATSSAMYQSGATNNPGYKILELPYTVGHSWERMTSSGGGGVTDSTIDIDDAGDDGLYLTDGDSELYSTMSIVAKENVVALDGHTYSNCLKIEWQVGEYAYNYFWYAAGIGLVKYENVPNILSASENNTVSVMSDFEQIAY